MKIISLAEFVEKLPYHQQVEFESELDAQAAELVIPHLRDGSEKHIEMNHFMSLKGRRGVGQMFVSALALHWIKYDKPFRLIKKVRIYESEFDMEFYMALEEYENKVDPNVILFN
jgi:hypothetical protein